MSTFLESGRRRGHLATLLLLDTARTTRGGQRTNVEGVGDQVVETDCTLGVVWLEL